MAAQAIGSENGIQKGDDQITFPSVYESVYKGVGKGFRYYPTVVGGSADLPEGDDFQSQWHQQKKKDADFMASQKVLSTQHMNARAFSSFNGYYGMPKPVLGQRKFANPSGGSVQVSGRLTDSSAPFHWSDAGSMSGMELSGGVLRSTQGQEYGKKVLLSRIAQLNAIDASKQNFANNLPTPAISTADRSASTQRPSDGDPASGDVREGLKIELNQLLRAISDALEGGPEGLRLSRFNYADATRMLAILFRLAPRVDVEDLEGLVGDVSNTLEDLIALTDPDNTTIQPDTRAIAASLAELYANVREYLRLMLRGANLSTSERIALSKNLVKSLGFSKLGQQTPTNVQFAQEFEDINSGEEFTQEAQSREDTDHGTTTTSSSSSSSSGARGLPVRQPRDGFDSDERTEFGRNSGSYYPSGGRPAAEYFGETAPAPPAAGAPAPAPAPAPVAAAAPGLRRVFDRDTQGFNVAVAPRSVAPTAPAAAPGLPTTPGQLREQTRTMDGVRDLVARMNVAGVPHRVRASTAAPDIARKNIAKKLGISGRF